MDTLSFTLPEILSLIGLTQCVYLLVHILFSAGKALRAGWSIIYFLILGFAFFADASHRHLEFLGEWTFYMQWAGWFMVPPLSVLMSLQMAGLKRKVSFTDSWIILLLPLGFFLSGVVSMNAAAPECTYQTPCTQFKEFLGVTGLMVGAMSLLLLFSKTDLFKKVRKQKHGVERYWLVLSLIILNTLFLSVHFIALVDGLSLSSVVIARTILGLGFVYLVSTSLLRMFPAAAKTSNEPYQASMTDEERALASKIQDLLDLDKIYHEPTYSRSDLAKECGVPETLISKVINAHFEKSFPQIMNERRIEDAKRLLLETDATVKTISEEVGFNSLPSFNRAFKELTNDSPGSFRKSGKKS